MTGDRKHRTLKDQLESEIARAERRAADAPRHYKGRDWFQLTDEEEAVFAIDRARFPRMIAVWECYQTFKGIEHGGFDNALIEQARQLHPEWCGPDTPVISDREFAAFAREYGGMTLREGFATYAKQYFWQDRNGIGRYDDGS
jgi:hypothetical protein